jgi:hypothetical protein
MHASSTTSAERSQLVFSHRFPVLSGGVAHTRNRSEWMVASVTRKPGFVEMAAATIAELQGDA